MPTYGMVIDLNKCTLCQTCVTACKVENNVQVVTPEDAANGRAMFWMRMMSLEHEGTYPQIRPKTAPMTCMQCDEPPCIKVCPVRATYKRDDGIVAQVYPQCIGCRYCMANCPYTVKVFNWSRAEQPAELDRRHNPDVSVRPVGVVEKCTFCHHRMQAGSEKAKAEHRSFEPGDYIPACVEACPVQAIVFGDLEDGKSPVAKATHDDRVFGLLEELGTVPKVRYLHALE
jgi:Fe-S-cluster-containing dehydrogenase component